MRLERITIYPVKGLGGVDVESAAVRPWGLEGDRLWCVVDDEGLFLSQRTHAAMATILATWVPGGVVLMDARGDSVRVADPGPQAIRIAARVWKDRVEASLADEDCNRWLSDRLFTSCRLVRMTEPANARAIRKSEAQPGDAVSFADGFPVLCTATASLDWLRERVGEARVPMERFRSNLVVSTGEAWIENGWRTIATGGVELEVARPCTRCPVIDVDQASGAKDASGTLLRALSDDGEGGRKVPVFGSNLLPRRLGTLHVGDVISATSARS